MAMFTIDELTDLVDTAIAATESEPLDHRHVVCVFDVLTGLPSVLDHSRTRSQPPSMPVDT